MHVEISKFLSYVLRHRPDAIGLTLDREGFVGVEDLLAALARAGRAIDRATLEEIVATSPKQRFAIVGDRIRANQGHSIAVDLALPPAVPPDRLFHGTVERFLAAIERDGLVRGQRTHVHLSADLETARNVAARRGPRAASHGATSSRALLRGAPVILEVDARAMDREGVVFVRSENGVWLVDAVPARFLRRLV